MITTLLIISFLFIAKGVIISQVEAKVEQKRRRERLRNRLRKCVRSRGVIW